MLPIYIICHADCKSSGYICTYFNNKNIEYKQINVINDDIAGLDLAAVAGLVFMGGPHSVNDELPWLAAEIKLIQRAIESDIPLMGVCLGAQLISMALGAKVNSTKYLETGWHKIVADITKLADANVFNLDNTFEVFEWHEDTFAIPDGAVPIFRGHNHENQGYLYGKVLAMQFHLEMTEDMIYDWLQRYQHCIPEPSQYVQSHEQITEGLNERLLNLNAVADKIYGWWLSMINIRES